MSNVDKRTSNSCSSEVKEAPLYWVMLFLKGIVMGAADVVPGVSGGTIAFVTGIYTRFIDALKSLHPLSLMLWYRQGFAVFWRAIDGRFLLTLFAGIIVSIISLAKLIHYMLEVYPIPVWSFFFGLVLGSVFYLSRQVAIWRSPQVIAIVVGTIIAIMISILRPSQLPETWWMMMFAGFIAICAMILPGISGSFILLLMGMYSAVIKALGDVNVVFLASFIVGCIMGLIAFSHMLSYLLQRYYSVMIALLTGFLVGSLNVLWPWKQVLETTINRHGELIPIVQRNVSPFTYSVINEQSSMLMLALLTMSLGFLLVFSLDWLSNSHARVDDKV